MAAKSPQSMVARYAGKSGRQRLVDALCIQPVVAGNQTIAQKLAAVGTLAEVKSGKTIIQQGDSDNDMYFILSGQVAVLINGREIALRAAGQHVGEMALLDPTARRSGTVVARDATVLLKIAERDMTSIGAQHPELWRRVAVALGARLRERSKYIPEPHAEPVVFVGSSSESLTEAQWLSQSLNRRAVTSRLWTQGVFQLSSTTIEDLMRMATESDFAVLLFTPDDLTTSRGKTNASPRDNAVFELGLFMGALGRARTFLVVPRGVQIKLPTDLLGMTHLPFRKGGKSSIGKRLRPVAQSICRRVVDLGPR